MIALDLGRALLVDGDATRSDGHVFPLDDETIARSHFTGDLSFVRIVRNSRVQGRCVSFSGGNGRGDGHGGVLGAAGAGTASGTGPGTRTGAGGGEGGRGDSSSVFPCARALSLPRADRASFADSVGTEQRKASEEGERTRDERAGAAATFPPGDAAPFTKKKEKSGKRAGYKRKRGNDEA